MSTPTSAWDSCLTDIGGEKVATIKCLEVLFANTVSLIVGIVSLALFAMLAIGAFKYLTSGGDAKQTESARNTIFYAILGLVLIVSSYIIIKALEYFTGVKLTSFTLPSAWPTPTPET